VRNRPTSVESCRVGGGFVHFPEKLCFLRLLGRASRYSRPVLDVDRSFHRTELRPFRESLMFARPPRDAHHPAASLGRAKAVFVLAQQSVNLSDNQAVRLIHRERRRDDSLEEGQCYDHSYREHMSDHVEVVRLEPAGIRVEIAVEGETEHHVTTKRLKAQFEERLAARTRSSRRPRS
jgi:hypothetical protein